MDIIITECKRLGYLLETLPALIDDNDRVIVHRDGSDDYYESKNLVIISSPQRIGHLASIDKLMGLVTSEYYLHTEEDFLPLHSEYKNEAIDILEKGYDSVSLRGLDPKDHNRHPIVEGEVNTFKDFNGWKGFSWGPSIRRKSLYDKYGPYSKITSWDKSMPWEAEKKVGQYLFDRGCKFATTKHKYFHHIGKESTFGK